MFNFLFSGIYHLEKKTFKNGIEDLKNLHKNIISNIKSISILTLIFFVVFFLKDVVLGNISIGNLNYDDTNSLVLSGNASGTEMITFFSFILSIVSFMFLPIFSIIYFKGDFSIKDTLKEAFFKIFDYKIYLLAFLFLLMTLISVKIMFYPIFTALHEYSIDVLLTFFKSLIESSSNNTFQEVILDNKTYNEIYQILTTLDGANFIIYFILGSFFAIISFLFLLLSFIINVNFKHIGFFESLYFSIMFNIKNSMYFFAITMGIIVISVILYFVNIIPHLDFITSGIMNVYVFSVYSKMINQSIIENIE